MAVLFNVKAFEGNLIGASDTQFSDIELNQMMAQADMYFVQVRASATAGTSVTLTVVIDTSADGIAWTTKATPINALALSLSVPTSGFGSDLGTASVGGAFTRCRIFLGGSGPSAAVQVWVTGRTND